MIRRILILLLAICLFRLTIALEIPVEPKPVPEPVTPPKTPDPEPGNPNEAPGGESGPGIFEPGGGVPGVTDPNPAAPASPASLGKFTENGGQTPFTESESESESSEEAWEGLLDKIKELLEDINDALDDGNSASASASTFTQTYISTSIIPGTVGILGPIAGTQTRIPITTTFNPSQPSEACEAWNSLTSYCAGSDASCACYSGSYYVPEQWNSLAARCAGYECTNSAGADGNCAAAEAAGNMTGYCSANVRAAPSTAFAAVTQTSSSSPTTSAGVGASPTTDSSTASSSSKAGRIGAGTFTASVTVFFSSLLLGWL